MVLRKGSWVLLSETVTSKFYTHSINGVTNYAKQYFISGYKKQCTIGNCYIICQHTQYNKPIKPFFFKPTDLAVCAHVRGGGEQCQAWEH